MAVFVQMLHLRPQSLETFGSFHEQGGPTIDPNLSQPLSWVALKTVPLILQIPLLPTAVIKTTIAGHGLSL